MANYIALLRKDESSDYGVDFPDFPGCVSAGHTLEEARIMAAEALTGHVATMREFGDPLPAPSDLDAIMADPDNADAIAFIVTVPEVGAKSVRVQVTLPEDLLAQIDAATDNRSAFLARAARRALTA
jgi:predicted RNase H-like HicB family nuclease